MYAVGPGLKGVGGVKGTGAETRAVKGEDAEV